MEHQEIDTCPNDHIIYYEQHALKIECPKCHLSRYRTDQVTNLGALKVLRHIHIIPHLQ